MVLFQDVRSSFSSQTSTISIERLLGGADEAKKSVQIDVKTVRFVEERNDVFLRGANQVGVYPSKLWYRPQDFVSYKEKLVYDGKKTARACRDESSEGRIVHEVFVKITKNERLDKVTFHKLSKFLQANPQVTGLERFCSRTIFSDKRSRRARMTQEVLLSAEDLSMGEEDYSLNSLEAELATISRPSRNFAKVLAFASMIAHVCQP